MATHNARQTDRAPYFAEIDVLAADAALPRRLWGGDVSEAGMFLQTTHPFRVGDRVALRFDVDDQEVHVRAAEVMWVRAFEPISVDGKMPGIGLRFVTLDPPARAALRRLVRKAAGEHRPGDTTLPDVNAQALPSGAPSTASFPPVTHSMLTRAGAARTERTVELPAISMAPFTDPPRPGQRAAGIAAVLAAPLVEAPLERFSLPPDEPALAAEERVFDTPAAVTLGPKRASAPPAPMPTGPGRDPFEGWRFRKAEPVDTDGADRADHGDSAPPQALGLRFDDERPGSVLEHSADDDSGPRELHLPAAIAHDREPEPSFFDRAVSEGASLSAKPVAAERRRAPERRPLRVLPLAAALLASGALVGIGVGVVSKRIERMPAELARAEASTVPAEPGGSPAPLAEEPAQASASAAMAPAPIQAVAAIERTITPVDVVAGALAAPTPREQAAEPAAARKVAATPKAPATVAAAASSARVELAVGNARVLKTFTLTGPNRVVVDLAEATLPGKALPSSDKGVTRVRFGAPAPGTSRVVVETEEAARQPSARVVGGRLIISFAS